MSITYSILVMVIAVNVLVMVFAVKNSCSLILFVLHNHLVYNLVLVLYDRTYQFGLIEGVEIPEILFRRYELSMYIYTSS